MLLENLCAVAATQKDGFHLNGSKKIYYYLTDNGETINNCFSANFFNMAWDRFEIGDLILIYSPNEDPTIAWAKVISNIGGIVTVQEVFAHETFTGVEHDATLEGDGTTLDPLRVAQAILNRLQAVENTNTAQDLEIAGLHQTDTNLLNLINTAATSGNVIDSFTYAIEDIGTFTPLLPANTADTYIDFNTMTCYKAKSDLSGWDLFINSGPAHPYVDNTTGILTPPANNDGQILITKKLWNDPEQTYQYGGKAFWSYQTSIWRYYPTILDISQAIGYTPNLFDNKLQDYELHDMAWQDGNENQWLNGNVYKNAYNHLLQESFGSAPTLNNWVAFTTGATGVYNDAISMGNGKAVVGTTTGEIFYTADYGATWTQATAPTTSRIKFAFSTFSNTLIACQQGSSNIFISTDYGATWTTASNVLPNGSSSTQHIVYQTTLDIFVLVDEARNCYIANAPANTWTACPTIPTAVTSPFRLMFSGVNVVVSSGSVTDAVISTDGCSTWTAMTMPIAVFNGGWAENGGTTIVNTSSNSAGINYSNDSGATFGYQPVMPTVGYIYICYGNSQFVALRGNNDSVATSPDGLVWTNHTGYMPVAGAWKKILYLGSNKYIVFTNANDGYRNTGTNPTTQTDTIHGHSITYVRATDGHKIADVSQDTARNDIMDACGIAWYYLIDTVNKRFKLPMNTGYMKPYFKTYVGNYLYDGLPDHTHTISTLSLGVVGSFTITGQLAAATGAFSVTNVGSDPHGWNGNGQAKFRFDLGGNISVSGNTSTTVVQSWQLQDGNIYPYNTITKFVDVRSTNLRLYFYLGEFTSTALQETAGVNMTILNSKLDAVDLTNTLALIYQVGSIYIGTQATCPMSSVIAGSVWQLEGTQTLASIVTNVWRRTA